MSDMLTEEGTNQEVDFLETPTPPGVGNVSEQPTQIIDKPAGSSRWVTGKGATAAVFYLTPTRQAGLDKAAQRQAANEARLAAQGQEQRQRILVRPPEIKRNSLEDVVFLLEREKFLLGEQRGNVTSPQSRELLAREMSLQLQLNMLQMVTTNYQRGKERARKQGQFVKETYVVRDALADIGAELRGWESEVANHPHAVASVLLKNPSRYDTLFVKDVIPVAKELQTRLQQAVNGQNPQ